MMNSRVEVIFVCGDMGGIGTHVYNNYGFRFDYPSDGWLSIKDENGSNVAVYNTQNVVCIRTREAA